MKLHKFSTRASCPDHPDFAMPELEPRLFSFNSPHGACPACHGLGEEMVPDPALVITPALAIAEGAIHPWADGSSSWAAGALRALAKKYNFSLQTPWADLPAAAREVLLFGEKPGEEIEFSFGGRFSGKFSGRFPGILAELKKRFDETDSDFVREKIGQYLRPQKCEKCGGVRLRPEALAVTVGGKNIVEVARLSVGEAREFFAGLGGGEK